MLAVSESVKNIFIQNVLMSKYWRGLWLGTSFCILFSKCMTSLGEADMTFSLLLELKFFFIMLVQTICLSKKSQYFINRTYQHF